RAWPRNDCRLVYDNGSILDEHRIGQVRVGFNLHDMAAKARQTAFVRAVLDSRELDVDWRPGQVRQLAAGNGPAHLARRCNQHGYRPLQAGRGESPHGLRAHRELTTESQSREKIERNL